jgi:hypothetical protein
MSDAGSPTTTESLWTEAQTAEILNLTIPALRKMRVSGEGPPFLVVGKVRIRYRPSAVQKWQDEREFTSMAAYYAANRARAAMAAKQRTAAAMARRARHTPKRNPEPVETIV